MPLVDRVARRGDRRLARRRARIAPPSRRSTPKTARASSVRPEPTRPARPRISPRRTARSTDCGRDRWRSARRSISRRSRAGRRCRRQVERLEVAADHQADHGVVARSRRVELADHAAVAQHHDAVGAALDLVQPVRDEDDADAVGLQLGDDLACSRSVSESVRLEVGSSMMTRRGIERQRLGDLDQLPLRERQLGDRRIGREIDAQAVQQRLHRAHAAACGRSAAAARHAAARGR